MIIFLVIILVAGVLVYGVVATGGNARRTTHHARRSSGRGVDRQLVAQRWQTIQLSASSGPGLRNAITEADKLVDYVMRQSGAPGETMGDRLKTWGSRFSDINGLWRAHKLRNALAHEVGFDLIKTQADEALRDFERALRDLGAL